MAASAPTRPSLSRAGRRLAAGLSALLLHATCALAAPGEEVVVIAHRDNPNTVSAEFVVRIYTGAIKGWPDGSPVMAFDQPEDAEAREAFCTAVLRKSPANLKAIWSQNIFTGKGLPPKVAGTDEAMKRMVAANPNAIGYIHASQVDGSVKVLKR
jgi:ABC-type phosphate transport system substrate-binding protein